MNLQSHWDKNHLNIFIENLNNINKIEDMKFFNEIILFLDYIQIECNPLKNSVAHI